MDKTKDWKLTTIHQSRGRYDPALAGICFQMLLELFGRTLNGDLGPMAGEVPEPEDVC
jgi:carboxymethylenebutenolidase